MPATDAVTLTAHELSIFAYHVGCIYRDSGRFTLSCRPGVLAEVLVTSRGPHVNDPIWDQVEINGHSCGNRSGGAKAYARLVAGHPEWWRPA